MNRKHLTNRVTTAFLRLLRSYPVIQKVGKTPDPKDFVPKMKIQKKIVKKMLTNFKICDIITICEKLN